MRLLRCTCHPMGLWIVAARLQVPDERAGGGESDTRIVVFLLWMAGTEALWEGPLS